MSIRRQDQIDAYKIDDYIITLERLHNTPSGNPRFKAVIIHTEPGAEAFYNAVYTFNGHYYNNSGEAKYILDYHRNNNK